MAQRVASIFAELGLDSSKFSSGASSVLSGLDDITGAFGFSAMGAASFAGALTLVVTELGKAADAATEAAVAQAKLDAVYKATGGTVGMTTEELGALADELSRATGIDDELVMSAQAVMLTFTQLQGQVFPQAMQAAADMSVVFDQDLKGSVMQVSKALNDFSGYTALKRSGVSFTQSQVEMIKNFQRTNDLAGYQALILQELQKEFGGAAEAVNAAGDGSANLNIEIGNLYENIGKELLPEIRGLNHELTLMLRTINENWQGIMKLYYGLDNIRRIIQFIGSLGVSELLRWFLRRSTYTGDGPEGAMPNGNQPNDINHNNGGSFIIPSSYGYEGFRMGANATASGGERVTVTPANQPMGGTNITISNLTIGDTSNLTRQDVTEMIGQAFETVIGAQ